MSLIKKSIKKVSGSTLIEVIVALVISTICTGIALLVFINVNRANNSRLKLNASLLMNEIILDTKTGSRYIDEEYDYEYMVIYKTLEEYGTHGDIKLLHLEAFSRSNKKILEIKEIIKVNQ